MWSMDEQPGDQYHATSNRWRRSHRPTKSRSAWRSRGMWLVLVAAAVVTSSCSSFFGDGACDLRSESAVATTAAVSPPAPLGGRSVTAGGPGFVAVGSGLAHDQRVPRSSAASDIDVVAAVWTSTDGVTWSRVPHDESVFGGPGQPSMKIVIAGGPGLVAVGTQEKDSAMFQSDIDVAVWTSADGVAWSRVPHVESVFGGNDDQEIFAVIAGGPGLVAVGRDGASYLLGSIGNAAVWTSPDGVTWSRVPHKDSVFGKYTDQEMRHVVTRGSGLVASGVWEKDRAIWADKERGTIVWASTDGVTWSRCS